MARTRKQKPTADGGKNMVPVPDRGQVPRDRERVPGISIEQFERLPEADRRKLWKSINHSLTEAASVADWEAIIGIINAAATEEMSSTAAEAIHTAVDTAQKTLAGAAAGITETMASVDLGPIMEKAAEVREAQEKLRDMLNSPEIRNMFNSPAIRDMLNSPAIRNKIEQWQKLRPFYHEVMQERPRKEGQPAREYEQEIMAEARKRARAAGVITGPDESMAAPTSAAIATIDRITQYYMATNKLANDIPTITKEKIKAGEIIDLVVANKGKPSEILTSYSILIDDDKVKNISGKPYTRFDRAVTRAICSVWEMADQQHRRPIFTDRQLFHLMKGNISDDNPSPQRLESIRKSREKQLTMMVEIDATAEAELRKVKDPVTGEPVVKYHKKRPMLYYQELTLTTKTGKEYTAYELRDIPPVWEYSKLVKQYTSVPAAMLSITDSNGSPVAVTESRIAMLDYLLQRYAVMRRDENEAINKLAEYEKKRKKNPDLKPIPLVKFREQSRTILFDTLFKETDLADTDKVTRARNRKYVMDVLDSWVSRKFMSKYEVIKKGIVITGVTLTM